MPILACGCTGRRCRCAPPTTSTPPTPVLVDPSGPAEPEPEPEPLGVLSIDPAGEPVALVLSRIPAGIRIRVEAMSTDAAAIRWLRDVGVAALVLAMRCEEAAAATAAATTATATAAAATAAAA